VIEYVKFEQWNGKDHCLYLEMFGEASPRLTSAYTQVPLPGESDGLQYGTNLAPLYEYYWSLGYIDLDEKCGPDSWGGEHEDTAAKVALYFPSTGGWRIEELVATIKYLCPAKEHASHLQDAANMFQTAKPIVEGASALAGAVGSVLVPGIGSIAAGAVPIAASTASLLDVITRLKVTSVPPGNGYEWCVQKVTQYIRDEGILHGIKWTIPKKLFVELGSRLTGSIAVNIIPSVLQSSSEESDHIRPRRLPIRAKAAMYLHPGRLHLRSEAKPVYLPIGDDSYLELEIEPRASRVGEYKVRTRPQSR
jgi:hypothetical protein